MGVVVVMGVVVMGTWAVTAFCWKGTGCEKWMGLGMPLVLGGVGLAGGTVTGVAGAGVAGPCGYAPIDDVWAYDW